MKLVFDNDNPITRLTRFTVITAHNRSAVEFLTPTGLRYMADAQPGIAPTLPDDVYWSLPTDDLAEFATQILERLGRAYTGDVDTLRADYDAERARVDQFIAWHLGRS